MTNANDRATKEELAELRAQVKEQLIDLKDPVKTMQEGFTAIRPHVTAHD